MKIVVVGSGGRLGAALARELGSDHQVVGFRRKDLDLTSPETIRKISLGGSNTFHERGMINLTHPEASPVLLNLLAKSAGGRATGQDIFFQNKTAPKYMALLAILKEAKHAIDQNPRMDMPGATPIHQERNFGRTF